MEASRRLLNENAVASGRWRVHSYQVASQSERINDALQRQKMGLADVLRNHRNIGAAMRQQMRLQQSMALSYGTNKDGKVVADLFVPTGVEKSYRNIRMEIGYINALINSVAGRTIDWGKNTQWAGRQITVALSVPLGIAAAAAGALGYQVDKELTRIAKVYDTNAQTQKGQEMELMSLRENSLRQSIRLAREYGVAVTDSLDVQAQLAAVGFSGNELLGMSSETVRIAALGEVDMQTAIDSTVALSTAFDLSNEKLTETFNLMNAIENATSLSINDIAEAVPRAASALAGLDVSAEQMTVMLVAMREAGVNATEGANALKSATTRILNPTRRAVEQFEALGININSLVSETGGNLYDLMARLGEELQGVDNLTRQQAIASLFGTYQFNRVNALLQNLSIGLGLVEGDANQTAQAIAVLQEGSEAWAESALNEVQRAQNSLSGQLLRMIEEIKGEMAALGEPVMEMIIPLVRGIRDLIVGFNELPEGTRKFTISVLAFLGLIGPAIMLLGVFANLTGQIFKFITAFGNLFLKFKIINPEQRLQAQLANTAASSFNAEAAAVAQLTLNLQQMQRQMAQAAGVPFVGPRGGQMIATSGGIDYFQNKAGNFQVVPGQKAPDGSIRKGGAAAPQALNRQFKEMASLNDQMSVAERRSRSISVNTNAIAGGIGAAALAASLLGSQTGVADDNAQKLLTTVGSLAMVMTFLPGRTLKLGGAMSRLGGVGGKIVGFFNKIPAIIGRILSLGVRLWGPVGIIASGAIIMKQLYDSTNDAEKAQMRLNDEAEKYAEIMGYTYTLGAKLDEADPYNGMQERIKQMRKDTPELVKQLEEVNNASEARVWARNQMVSSLTSGASVEQASIGLRTSLSITGIGRAEVDAIVDSLAEEFQNADTEKLSTEMSAMLNRTMNNAFARATDRNWIERLFGSNRASDESMALGREMGMELANGMATFGPGTLAGKQFLDQFQRQFEERTPDIFEEFTDKYGQIVNSLGLTSEESLKRLQQQFDRAMESGSEYLNFNGQTITVLEARTALDAYNNVRQESIDIERAAAQEAARQLGLDEKRINNFRELSSAFYGGLEKEEEVRRRYNETIRGMGAAANYLSDADRDQIANTIRKRMGLSQVANAADQATQSQEDLAEAVEETNERMAEAEDRARMYVDGLRNSMTQATNGVMQEAARLFSDQQQAELDGIQAASDRRIRALEASRDASAQAFENRLEALRNQSERDLERFDSRWETVLERNSENWKERIENEEAAYEARTEAIERQIEAEEEADKRRDELFDKEIERLRSMAEAANRNIDINAALRVGNFDEAAKLQNDALAQESVGEVEAARDRLKDASERRREALRERVDMINEEKDTRLEALREMQDAEAKALQKQRDAEKKALQDRQKEAEENLQNQKKAADDMKNHAIQAERERTQAVLDARRKEQEATQRRLDAELNSLRQTIPSNEAEYRAYVRELERIYSDYGITLRDKGTEWGQFVGTEMERAASDAQRAIRDDIKWKELGERIVKEMSKAVNLTPAQLRAFLQTGKLPMQYGQAGGGGGSVNNRVLHTGGVVRHNGGPGWSSADRTGIPRSASLYPSEVPAILKRGEYVMNEKAVRFYGLDHLDAINERRVDMEMHHRGGSLGPTSVTPAVGSKGVSDAIRHMIMISMLGALASLSGQGDGSLQGGSFDRTGGGWPPRRYMQISPNTAAAAEYVRRTWGINNIGILGQRANKSDHPYGKAIDVMIPNWKSAQGIAEGNDIASYFVKNPDAFGTKYVIWRDQINSGSGWRSYTHPSGNRTNPTLAHRDHVHTSFLHQGGLPQLLKGARIRQDNTLVNTHKGESVLTAPLTRRLSENILDGAGGENGTTYNFNFGDVTFRDEADMDKFTSKVEKSMDKINTRKGRSRRIN